MNNILNEIQTPELSYVNIYITWNCNFRCIHCWVEGEVVQNSLLDINKVKRFIKESKDIGAQTVRITGGEPLSYKNELMEIISYNFSLGMKSEIETNAFLFDNAFIEFLYKNNVSCGISLNGYNSETNDSFTGKKGSFDIVVNNIKEALNAGVDLSVVTCVGKYNIDYFEKSLEFIYSLGVSSVKINPVSNCGRGNELYDKGLIFSDEELIDFYGYYKKLRGKYEGKISTMIPPCLDDLSAIAENGIYVCGGANLLSYLPNNKISLCGYGGINDKITLCGYTDDMTVEKIWNNNKKLLYVRETFYKLAGVCGSCIHGKSCRSLCKVQGLQEYGDWNAPYPTCQKALELNKFPESRLFKKVDEYKLVID